MKKKEKEISPFSVMNSWAMVHGLFLGAWGIAAIWMMGASFTGAFEWSLPAQWMLLGWPVAIYLLSRRFRSKIASKEEAFTFIKGFAHTLFMGLYAGLWLAMWTYVYLTYFDNGHFFDAYEQQILQPHMTSELQRMGVWQSIEEMGGVEKVVNMMRSIGAAGYAGMMIYLSIIISPIVSVLVGLMLRREKRA